VTLTVGRGKKRGATIEPPAKGRKGAVRAQMGRIGIIRGEVDVKSEEEKASMRHVILLKKVYFKARPKTRGRGGSTLENKRRKERKPVARPV